MKVNIATVVVGDGRHRYLLQTLGSFYANVTNASDHLLMVDDTGDAYYAAQLDQALPEWKITHHPERRGMAAAVRSAWGAALNSGCDYFLHLEEDFTFNGPLDVLPMAHLLDSQPHLASLTLKRQPWAAEEIAAGGQMELAPEKYTERGGATRWCEHEHLFSFNPSVVSVAAIRHIWGNMGDGLERGVTDALLARGYKFAYWGGKADLPRVTHIGHARSANYRW